MLSPEAGLGQPLVLLLMPTMGSAAHNGTASQSMSALPFRLSQSSRVLPDPPPPPPYLPLPLTLPGMCFWLMCRS